MLKLASTNVVSLGNVSIPPRVWKITEDTSLPASLRANALLLLRSSDAPIPPGFNGYLFLEMPADPPLPNSFLLDAGLEYLSEGDVIRLHPTSNSLRTLYRRNSTHNFFLLTERCNNFCLMCSQPPKVADDSYLVNEVLQTIPLIDPSTESIGITGGEPSLLGAGFIALLQSLQANLPKTAVHVLSNGRLFKNLEFAKAVASVGNSNLMLGIPLYSDLSNVHDYVVQAAGAFNDTIRGILNLKSCGVRVEIRVVVHKLTYERLPDLAQFLRRNLSFCDHVALMGLELTGFTKINMEKLWIDPADYQPQLKEAANLLAEARIPVSIYNHQMCVLDPSLHPFNVKSISDWKNEFMAECDHCTRKSECGGFFSSSKLHRSRKIAPFN